MRSENPRVTSSSLVPGINSVEYGFIRRYAITDASVYDSQVLGQLLDDENDLDAVSAMLELKHLTYNFKRFLYHQAQLAA
ncbi:transposase IS4 family protein [Leptolyngbya sp. NIES-3755]|nr:transposase IS4 family protein [Leptolyngbya sp. NIES-3755]